MAGMGPAPKPPGTRARRNRTATAAVIKVDPTLRAPKLPAHPGKDDGEDWHEQVKVWWKDAWNSPMAPEFVDADKHGLFVIALLRDGFWKTPTPRMRAEIAAEIRLQEQRYGFSPVDRRRLQWEVDKGEEAQQRTSKRRAEKPEPGQAPASAPTPMGDPRSILRSV